MTLRMFVSFALLFVATAAQGAPVTIVKDGRAEAAIFVPARLMDDAAKNAELPGSWHSLKPEDMRRRLRESVQDFAAILERISGAKIDIVVGKPVANDKRIPILIGELAAERFGKPEKSFPYGQGFRLVVSAQGVGVAGESDLATSYGLYTLLDQLGCRWYMPGTMGEVLPRMKTITLPEQDLSTGPYTIYRGLWFTTSEYARRNRLGGMQLSAGHALEASVPKVLRKSNPEIRAIIKGKPHAFRVKWTHPLVAKALSDGILNKLGKDPTLKTFSLSPDDGLCWDESDDAKLDAGDFDPSVQETSKTDRLMVLANRVGTVVADKHPDVRLGILAYADYTRAPVREKVHPIVVPQIAPITYARAQPMHDDGEPNNKDLRAIVEGWGKAAPATSYYFYGWFLAEPSAPNPLITKWGSDIPYIYKKGNCRYWQPETQPNFESCMHALYMGIRMAWDPEQKPAAIVDELHEKFYGSAAKPMADYWHFIDDVWVKTPEYSGCGFAYLRRWTPERMTKARALMDTALAVAKSPEEKDRVGLANESLRLFELFMKLRRDQADGKLANLAADAESWRTQFGAAAERYKENLTFTKTKYAPKTLSVNYFAQFYEQTYKDASRVARDFDVLTAPPLRTWKYQADPDKKGEKAGWMNPAHDDAGWKKTDVCVETWSALGQHNYMGALWYRATVAVPKLPAGKKCYLWIGSTDGRVKVFVNGKHVPYVNAKNVTADSFTGYCQPASFDLTAELKAGDNQISLLCTREFINELGTGGLLAPPVLYREK